MKRIEWLVILVFLLFADRTLADGPTRNTLPPEIREYSSWTSYPNVPLGKMNPALCSIPPKYLDYSSNQLVPKGVHKDKFLSVYFNGSAKDVIDYLRRKDFPTGSIIVKEKKTTHSSAVDGIGVMVKRDRGFDSEVGDWEFMYLDSGNEFTRGNSAAQNCKSCHMQAKSTDYVFGNYAKVEAK